MSGFCIGCFFFIKMMTDEAKITNTIARRNYFKILLEYVYNALKSNDILPMSVADAIDNESGAGATSVVISVTSNDLNEHSTKLHKLIS